MTLPKLDLRSSTLALAALFITACGSDSSADGTFSAGPTAGSTADATSSADGSSSNEGDESDGSDEDQGDDGPKFDLGGDLGGGPDMCGEVVDNPIYVLTRGSENNEPEQIFGFDPETLAFEWVVDVVCAGTEGWAVSSMAVDRNRHAWIQWGSPANGPSEPYPKRLDRLNLDTGECLPDQGQLPMSDEWASGMGMAFVSETEGSGTEQLFFVDHATYVYPVGGDPAIGKYYEFQQGQGTVFSGTELTGTGEGRLFILIMNWSFEFDHPCTADNPCGPEIHLGEVDKQDGTALSNVELPDIDGLGLTPGGFAFAHWGGRFWIFISENFGPTKVYDYDPVEHTNTLVSDDGPAAVVGAGVSTCAPIVFPPTG
ncbi:hypothetical protein [Enhygromyxa salina]|uniref:Uncharacterized protein n=1 Tax=Enhygromyxa salina TaxID=215803 RepID=A0A2S9Y829_9BACT|nr:hypothetical protein [Enhygromyxa salina]PRQ01264.1 hypothetical protein ENSA7_58690 [Enhygromyxa salina]